MLDRALCAAKVDVLELIEKVFFGRKKVYAKELYAYAKTRGVSKNALRRYLKAFGYKVKKDGPGPGAPWAYINKNSEWKEQLKVVTGAELKAAEQELTKHDDLDWMDAVSTDSDYFADI